MTQTGGVWWWRGSGTEQRSLAAARDWHENVGVDARIFAHALVKVLVQRLNTRLAERREDFTCVVSLLTPLTTPRVHFTVYLPCRHDFMQRVEKARRFGKRFIYLRPSTLYFENFHYTFFFNDLHSRKQATQLFKLYVLNKIQEKNKRVLPFKSRARPFKICCSRKCVAELRLYTDRDALIITESKHCTESN